MAKAGSGSKADTAVKLVLVFFVSLLSFSVGTFVGKKVSDANHRQADLEVDYSQDKEAHNQADASPDPEAVSEAEVAALTKEFMDAERSVASEDEAHKATEHKTEEGYTHMSGENEETTKNAVTHHAAGADKKEDKVKHAADRVAETKSPTADQKKTVAPSKDLPGVATSSIGKYTVQVSSHATEDEAKTHVGKLKEKGYGAFYVPAEVKGQTWFRVSIGLFTDQKSASNYRSEVLKGQAVQSAIVQKIVK